MKIPFFRLDANFSAQELGSLDDHLWWNLDASEPVRSWRGPGNDIAPYSMPVPLTSNLESSVGLQFFLSLDVTTEIAACDIAQPAGSPGSGRVIAHGSGASGVLAFVASVESWSFELQGPDPAAAKILSADQHFAMPEGWTGFGPLEDMRPLRDLIGPGPDQALGSGRTELISQTYNSVLGRYEFSGNQETDAVLIGSRWIPTTLTFSFPTSGTFYAGQGYGGSAEPSEHVVFNAAQQAAARYAFAQISAYTNLTLVEVTETDTVHADFRLSQTDLNAVRSAYANFPSSSPQAGDMWFGRTNQPFYDTPAPGNWGQATIMHEIGHAMGLKHGHDSYTSFDLAGGGYLDHPVGGGPRYGSVALPPERDGQSWSLMTYRPAPGSLEFAGEGFNQPQTYMQDDIAALQHLYGANFATQGGDTVYSWDPLTGERVIDGVGQGAPTGNKILMTLWDGNGIDTYDLSNYSTNLDINLEPGQFSTFSSVQLANHLAYSGGNAPAAGNVANARLFQGDLRSLIENANGGTGNDFILGNQAANTLRGNDGADTLIGSVGSDTLVGGDGADVLYGDGAPVIPSGIVPTGDGVVSKLAGLGNIDLASALDVSSEFNLSANANILESTMAPHVTISGVGDGNKDYYKIVLTSGASLLLDIDNTTGGLDSFIRLLDSAGNVLLINDDSPASDGGGGSTSGLDSLIRYTTQTGGIFYIEVGQYLSSSSNAPIAAGKTYDLQISVANPPAQGSGNGDDLLEGGLGDDQLYGGAGNDTASYAHATGSVVVDLGTDVSSGADGADTLQDIENLLGSDFDDNLTGDARANVLRGGLGSDVISGAGGADQVFGDEGNDLLIAGIGGGFLDGGSGIDTVSYRDALFSVSVDLVLQTGQSADRSHDLFRIENVIGSSLSDQILGDAYDNLIEGGLGDDTLNGNAGIDTASYIHALGSVFVSLATGKGSGADGADTLIGIENLVGSDFNDTLSGDAGANSLEGGVGDDILIGGDGKDVLIGGGGNDSLNGGKKVDTASYVTAQAGVVVSLALTGVQNTQGSGLDTLFDLENLTGSQFADSLTGNDLDNLLVGADGDDVLSGGKGADTLNGGLGIDTASFASAGGGVTARLLTGKVLGGAGKDSLASIENLTGSTFKDELYGDSNDNILDGGNADDFLEGGEGNDSLIGGLGRDIASYVSALGGVSVSLSLAGPQNTLGAGVDLLSGIEDLTGSAFNDTLTGDAGANRLTGGAGLDTLTGGEGLDTLFGGNGIDQLFGDGGNDVLQGGAGADILTGGTGKDRFIYLLASDSSRTERDLITDLTATDTLDLSAIDANSLSAGDQAFVRVGSLTGVAGQYTLAYDGVSGQTLLSGDINGDGRVDLAILFSGDVTSMTSGWVL